LSSSDGRGGAPSRPAWLRLLEDLQRAAAAKEAADPEGYAAELAKYDQERREFEAANGRERREDNLDRAKVRLPDGAMEAIVSGLPRPTQALALVRAWWRSRSKPWLALAGDNSVGKSVAAAVLLADEGGRWISSSDLVRVFAGLYPDSQAEQDRLKSARMLVIDDLGDEDDPERMQKALKELFDERGSAKRTPTVFTVNLSKQAFIARYTGSGEVPTNRKLRERFAELLEWATVTENVNLRRSK